MIPGSRQILLRGGYREGVELSLHGRHQIILKIPVELPQGVFGGAEVPGAVFVVEGGGHGDDGLHFAVFDHVIQHVFHHAVAHIEVFAGSSAPAVHQIQDIIMGFQIVFVVAVRQIDGCRFLNWRIAIQGIFGIIGDPYDAALLRCRSVINGGNRGSVACLWDGQGIRVSFRMGRAGWKHISHQHYSAA